MKITSEQQTEVQNNESPIVENNEPVKEPVETKDSGEQPKDAPEEKGVKRLSDLKKLAEKATDPAVDPGEKEGAEPASKEDAPDKSVAGEQKPKFEPNFKVKAFKKEYEIPEKFRSLITDADSEKEVREIFEKAYGVESFKERLKEVSERATTFEAEKNKVVDGFGHLQKLSASDNINEFEQALGALKISPEKILQYANYLQQLNELPPEARAQLEQQKRIEAQHAQQMSQYQIQSQEVAQLRGQMRIQELNGFIGAREDISSIANEYDTRQGRAGAFRELVVRLASQHDKDISVEDAVRETMNVLGYEEIDQHQERPEPKQKASSVPPVIEKKLPVIPSVGGTSTVSPVAKKVTRISDLKKLYKDGQAKSF